MCNRYGHTRQFFYYSSQFLQCFTPEKVFLRFSDGFAPFSSCFLSIFLTFYRFFIVFLSGEDLTEWELEVKIKLDVSSILEGLKRRGTK